MEEIGFVSQEAVPSRDREEADVADGPDEPAQDPYARVEKRRESDRIWAQFFPRRKSGQIQAAV
jgi:hypothetical protein